MAENAIYLDHQATSTLAPGVLKAMEPFFSDIYGNPHSSEHAFGWSAADAVEVARRQVADAVGMDPEEVIFTSGATEANNIVILGFDRDAAPRFAASAVEHKSVLAPVRERARRGCRTTILPVDHCGRVDLNALAVALDHGLDLVSIMAVNNEIGTAQPLREIAGLCHNAGALLHVDAAQALAFDGYDGTLVDADFVSLSSHKGGGPKGIGVLAVARNVRQRLSPVLFGGGQEDGLRPGTLPTPLCVGFGVACTALPDEMAVADWRGRADHLADLLSDVLPGCARNGGGPGAHPGNVSITLPFGDASVVIARMQPDLAVSTGSACTSGLPEPSHVLRAIGLDAAAAERTIRFSVGRTTTLDQITEAGRMFGTAVRNLV